MRSTSQLRMLRRMPGLSGLSLYVPRPRVRLDAWCEWTGAPSDKVRAVVGDAFRVAAGHEDAYTLAASAVLRLIQEFEVDPSAVGQLLLATESSADNAVGGPTVKGLVDRGLSARGLPPLARDLETFEVKQACLSGMNALLGAIRFVAHEPERVAIVVASDIAEYERGSSGEQTQGAGAVAMLVEAHPRLLAIDPARVGRSAADRICDFRKPVRAPTHPPGAWSTARPRDFPTFAGHYSTHCYLDAVDRAFLGLLERTEKTPRELLDGAALVLLHRPYDKMPISSLARMVLRTLEPGRLRDLAASCDVPLDEALRELDAPVDLAAFVLEHGVEADPTPSLTRLLRSFAKTPEAVSFIEARSGLGRGVTRQLGNLYAASLPAWLGAALEEAAREGRDLTGRDILLFGYGSGDASLAVSARVVPDWAEAAGRLAFEAALEGAIDLDRTSYERAHDRIAPIEIDGTDPIGLHRIGEGQHLGFDDRGIPYYGPRVRGA